MPPSHNSTIDTKGPCLSLKMNFVISSEFVIVPFSVVPQTGVSPAKDANHHFLNKIYDKGLKVGVRRTFFDETQKKFGIFRDIAERMN
ncbi:hypothetical protein CEXT_193441 [Caerostris extrusa]|uniref:Uncharacterized protein n=1 Tax=Caerostris extrusa TaxID=172846 RepID=A0AAV4PMS0_CAEEX|nr:hypothetical protein CEXT_193441 [Caerostris extrusa]